MLVHKCVAYQDLSKALEVVSVAQDHLRFSQQRCFGWIVAHRDSDRQAPAQTVLTLHKNVL